MSVLRKQRQTFQSDSDCEILLPMYEKYGTDLFAMLDAEFACIIYDGKTEEYIAARDPIGIRPLYYGYGKKGVIVFASEAKNLTDLCETIRSFPPGHYYKEGKQTADYIGSEHTEVIITKEDVLSFLENVIYLLGTYDITTIRASIGMYLVCKAIHETADIRVLLTGEISDELFGYKYADFAPSAEEF